MREAARIARLEEAARALLARVDELEKAEKKRADTARRQTKRRQARRDGRSNWDCWIDQVDMIEFLKAGDWLAEANEDDRSLVNEAYQRAMAEIVNCRVTRDARGTTLRP